jgi:transposase
MPSIVGGLDIHRKQITFDYAGLDTGEVQCGQVTPADREHFRLWLAGRFEHPGDVAFAVEACTGWRYVAGELAAAGIGAHLAEPADTATARGKKRRAKTDRADARLMRDLLAGGRLPECWIPPGHVLECRALLETYHALRREHTAWVQRVHAVLFHQGAPVFHDLSRAGAPQELAAVARAHLSPAGQQQIALYLRMLEVTEGELDVLRRQLVSAAGQMRGARMLAGQLYGVGPVTALALTCWLGGAGRFSSARKAVRFTGLDITVYSSDGKRSPGHLSRQGPPVLRWCAYEAGKAHARAGAPDHGYYAAVKDRKGGKRAALSEARKIVRRACHLLAELGDDAFATA